MEGVGWGVAVVAEWEFIERPAWRLCFDKVNVMVMSAGLELL